MHHCFTDAVNNASAVMSFISKLTNCYLWEKNKTLIHLRRICFNSILIGTLMMKLDQTGLNWVWSKLKLFFILIYTGLDWVAKVLLSFHYFWIYFKLLSTGFNLISTGTTSFNLI